MPDDLNVVAQAIKEGMDSTGATLRIALVTAVDGVTGKVQTDATGSAWVACDAGVGPTVGARVYALQQGAVTVVVGRLGAAAGPVTVVQPPVGAITPYAGATAPANWLVCDGSSLLRTTYPDLFAVLGTTYGSVDATHFTLPDLRGRGPLGASATHARGATGGAESVTLATTMTPDHSHGASQGSHSHTTDIAHGHTASQAAHSHDTISDHNHTVPAATVTAATGSAVTAKAAGSGAPYSATAAGGHTHASATPAVTVASLGTTAVTSVARTPTVTVDTSGAPTVPVPVLDPYVAMPYIIRAL